MGGRSTARPGAAQHAPGPAALRGPPRPAAAAGAAGAGAGGAAHPPLVAHAPQSGGSGAGGEGGGWVKNNMYKKA